MSNIDDILYAPIAQQLNWNHLWRDLDPKNQRLVRTILDNLHWKYFGSSDIGRKNPEMVDVSAEITAYVLPRLIANHIIGVQPIIMPDGLIHHLSYDENWNLEIRNYAALTKIRRLAIRILLDENDTDYRKSIPDLQKVLMVELDQDLMRILRRLPPEPTAKNTFELPISVIPTETIADEGAALAVLIGRESASIPTRTRRRRGNWAIVPPVALNFLDKVNLFLRDFCPPRLKSSSIEYVGMLEDGTKMGSGIQIYCDLYADDDTPILVGYKGQSEVDAGFFWSPYITVEPQSQVIDPNTFQTVQGFMTQYANSSRPAITASGFSITSGGGSADWFGLVGMNAHSRGFL